MTRHKTCIFGFSKTTRSKQKTVESFSRLLCLCRNLTSSGEEIWPLGCSCRFKVKTGTCKISGVGVDVRKMCINLIMFRYFESDFPLQELGQGNTELFRDSRTGNQVLFQQLKNCRHIFTGRTFSRTEDFFFFLAGAIISAFGLEKATFSQFTFFACPHYRN